MKRFFCVGILLLKAGVGFSVENESSSIYTIEDYMHATGAFNLDYFGIFYGPALKNPSAYQPSPYGEPNYDRPVILRNYLGLGYNLTEFVSVAATAHWIWQPVMGQQMMMSDPFVRVGHNAVIHSGDFNLYSDVRVHFPISAYSREMDMRYSFQSFSVATYPVGTSRLTLGTNLSLRVYGFGPQGYGSDLEMYLAPNLAYQISPKLAFTLLYEMQASHAFGQEPWIFANDGTDLEPGIRWDVTPNLMLNPYVNLFTGDKIALETTSIGMLMSWRFI